MVVAIKACGVAYAPVPKAGCTSVKMMLSQIDPDYRPARNPRKGNKAFHHRYRTMRYKRARWRPTQLTPYTSGYPQFRQA